MTPETRMIKVNATSPATPETVQDLIDDLAKYPPNWPISFAPYSLYRTKDRGEIVHFELSEANDISNQLLFGDK